MDKRGPPKKKKKRKNLGGAIRSAQRSPADNNAHDLHLTHDGLLLNKGASNFYNPAYKIAEQIQDAMNPDRGASRPGEVVYQKDKEDLRKYGDEEMVTFSYRVVHRETEKAYLFGINGKKRWLPKSKIELLPGNLVRVPKGLARRIYSEYRPKDI